MSFTNSNDYLTGRKPAKFPAGSEDVTTRFAVALATGDLALNTVGAVGILPAGCVPVAISVDADDLDSNGVPTVALAVGLLNAGETDLEGTAWASALTVGQAGGSVAPALSSAALRLAATQADRKIGVKVTTGAATAQAGTVGVTVTYRTAD